MALKSPPCVDDIIFESFVRGVDELPEVMDMRMYVDFKREQGKRGTCAAISGAVIREVKRYMEGHDRTKLSSEFIYFHREHQTSGMHGKDVFRILSDKGIPSESIFPCGSVDKPSRKASRQAKKNKIGVYSKVTTPGGLKHALHLHGPCYLALPCFNGTGQFWRKSRGRKLSESHPRYDSGVGHAVVVIGYNFKGFILLNSWGENWGDEGTTILPYKDWKYVWECWVPLAQAGSSGKSWWSSLCK